MRTFLTILISFLVSLAFLFIISNLTAFSQQIDTWTTSQTQQTKTYTYEHDLSKRYYLNKGTVRWDRKSLQKCADLMEAETHTCDTAIVSVRDRRTENFLYFLVSCTCEELYQFDIDEGVTDG